jgi:SAM-dependent methyltransferase
MNEFEASGGSNIARPNVDFYKRPFVPPQVALYSYHAVKGFLPVTPVRSVLEVGCGLAAFSFRYAARHPAATVMAVDISHKLIDFLCEEYQTYYPNIFFKETDFCDKDLSLDRQFDLIYSSHVLEHVRDPGAFVNNLHKSLAIGGRSVTNFPNFDDHGINHFHDTDDLTRLFSIFDDVRIYRLNIPKTSADLFSILTYLYDKLTFGKYSEKSQALYQSEKQGVDCFEESSAFEFVRSHKGLMNSLACGIGELFLLPVPGIRPQPVSDRDIRNAPRLVVVCSR